MPLKINHSRSVDGELLETRFERVNDKDSLMIDPIRVVAVGGPYGYQSYDVIDLLRVAVERLKAEGDNIVALGFAQNSLEALTDKSDGLGG